MTARSRRGGRYLGRVTAAQFDRAGTPHGPQTQSPRAVWASSDQPTSRDVQEVVDVGPPTVAEGQS